MTLTLAAQKVLTKAQSGVPDDVNEPLRDLQALLAGSFTTADLCSAIILIDEARRAAYAERRRIVLNLQHLEQSASYVSASPRSSASWQLSG